jgi:S-DNA-T family DNA segregation ATPase FtsK/SpoIIIE
LVEGGREAGRDLLVRAGERSTVADFLRAVGAVANPSVEAARLSLGAGGLVAGRVVRLDDLAAGHTASAGVVDGTGLELAVVGGLCAGDGVRLTPGAQPVTIGRGAGCDLRIDDREVSRVHASVAVAAAGGTSVTLQDLHSSNGTIVRGEMITAASPLPLEEPVVIGRSVVAVRPRDAQAADVEFTPDGRARFNRPPRTTAVRQAPTFNLPSAPRLSNPPHVSVAAALAPLVLGVVVALIAHQLTFLLFSLFSPVVVGLNAWSNRRRVRLEHEKAAVEYEEAKQTVTARLDDAVRAEEVARRRAAPDPATVVGLVRTPTLRLWERRPTDEDFLDVRVGLANLPSDVQVTGEGAEGTPVPNAQMVPVTVDLRSAGVVGIAGPRTEVLSVARAALAQLATLHCPDDVELVLLSDGLPEEWEWFKWLPHTEPRSGQPCTRLVALTPAQCQRRVTELLARVDERRSMRRAPEPAVVVVLDGARRLRSDERVAALLRDGPGSGVYAIGLAEDRAGLPSECRASVIISGSPSEGFTLDLAVDEVHVEDALPDGLPVELAEDVARHLAPFFLVSAVGDAVKRVPDPPVDELALLGLLPPSSEQLEERWRRRRGATAAAVVGLDADGPFEIDLRRDGPHALVAGATGAGKSELLQTLVAGLAASSAPTDVTFLLVDFKGGSAFRECEQLPHAVGVITNLDGRLVARALDSIQSELRWRQAAFLSVGAKDFDEYQKMGRADRPSIPRLVVVVDELKELVDAYSDAVARLSQTARLGRSLGVHLVFATQKPGSVTGLADLRANTDLRVCLRVLDAAESQDVVGAPDASRIPKTTPGRAVVRFGDNRLVVFQSGFLGNPVNPAASSASTVAVYAFTAAQAGEPRDTAVAVAPAPVAPTGLQALVGAARHAAATMGVPPLRRPWLPPLPALVALDELPATVSVGAAALGLLDLPAEQRQEALVVDLDAVGNVLISGPPRSGRTTALRTFAASLAGRAAATALHIYVIECRGRSLGDLERLPHCGAVVGLDDVERLERLLGLLAAEVEQRQGAPGAPPSKIVLLCDNYEAFFDRFAYEDGGRLVERLASLLSTGPPQGVHTVLTSDRRGLTGRLSVVVEARLVLRPVDRDDQAALGLAPGAVDPGMPPGRGYWYAGPAEAQVAVAGNGSETQLEAIERIADRSQGAGPGAPRVAVMPRAISAAEAENRRTRPRPSGAAVVTPVVGGIEVQPVDVDLAAVGGTFVVAGPRGSGRSTALVTITGSLLAAASLPICVVAPRRSPVQDLQGLPTPPVSDPDTLGTDLPAAVEEHEGRVAVVIDDAELLLDNAVSARLDRIVRSAADRGGVVVIASTTTDLTRRFSGWMFDARQSRTGLLLTPSGPADGDVFDVRLPRSIGTGPAAPPGRGLLVVRGEWVPAQVILPVGTAGAPQGSTR